MHNLVIEASLRAIATIEDECWPLFHIVKNVCYGKDRDHLYEEAKEDT